MHIINARLHGYDGLQQIRVEGQGLIQAIAPMTGLPSDGPYSLDVMGDWLSPGGVDLQINGALGLAFPNLTSADSDTELLDQICQFLWQQGVDAFLPTLVTTSIANIHRALATLAPRIAARSDAPTAQILGVHLEGPFLNPDKRGAHPAEYLLPLSIEQVQHVLGPYAAVVKVITLAPELDPTGQVIPYLRSLGITVSLGHSQATAAQAQQAIELGATMVTHAFNAMPSLHHRQPGLLAAAIAHPQVMCGFIADGQHVAPLMLDLLLRASHYDQGLFLVSDALSPLGLPDGRYPWDSRQITVTQGTAHLDDGTLAGTTLPLLVGVQNLVRWGICPVKEAIALATLSPRRAMGMATTVAVGQPAHLLRWQMASETDVRWQRLT